MSKNTSTTLDYTEYCIYKSLHPSPILVLRFGHTDSKKETFSKEKCVLLKTADDKQVKSEAAALRGFTLSLTSVGR